MSAANPVQYQEHLNVDAYLNLISFTLIYYEYFITLEIEVERYWAHWRTFSLASTIFFLNRYVAVFGHVPVIVQYFWTKEPSPYKQVTCVLFCG
ncbi:hypothetical protein Moror_11941 [Moniliophthora roreri MCA 2997]|uniref:DUF6533 domain-containing protein n=1 Tax=Moniliophthora roreri (strain MCA 2997) TaxID=1381753 RepID=V2X3L5_MONRO|nr:hypothetical protein Moror_11941 [Moniliophthora roreri MCA 2997]